MDVHIHPSLAERLPGFGLGVICYDGVAVAESPKLLQGRINLFVESLRAEHELSRLAEIEGVREWRAAFKRAGIDPSRYRPSSEALLRRLLQGQPFFWVNSCVDVNNFLSVRYALPYGIYDRTELRGPIVCRLGTDEDRYDGLNGRLMQMDGKLLLADDLGAFGSPIVDSVRTSVKQTSRDLLQVIFFHPQVPPAERDQILGATARMMTEVNGGEVVWSQGIVT